MSIKAIGIDIGGTTIKGGLFEVGTAADGSVPLKEVCLPTHGKEGREKILGSLFRVISALKERGEVQRIGISSAGNIDNERGICVYATDNLLGWTGIHLKEEVENRFGLPCSVDNDAICALKGELFAHPNVLNATMLTFGTGVGGASLINGEIVRGKNFDGGRWGHFSLVKNGRKCNCGKRGCAETYLSATALLKDGRKKIKNLTDVKELFQLAEKKDERAEAVLAAFGENLNLLLDDIRTAIAPETIILGGGVAQSEKLIFDRIERKDDIAFARLGNRAGMFGAICDACGEKISKKDFRAYTVTSENIEKDAHI